MPIADVRASDESSACSGVPGFAGGVRANRCAPGAIVRAACRSVAAALIFSCPIASKAAEGGVSNYVPGFYGDQALAVAPPDGLSVRNDVYLFSGDAGASSRSGNIEASAEIDLIYNYLNLLYKPGIRLFGAQAAFGATVVVGDIDVDARLRAGSALREVSDGHTGLGDLTLSGYLYWNWDKVHLAWANFVVAPVGDYDVNDVANTGLNYWTLETDLMVTYLDPDRGRDYSVVMGYGYNTENDDTSYRSGDEFHVDVVLNQYFSESFGVGLTGFFYRQLSGDSGAGARLGAFRGEAAGLGPAVYWNTQVLERPVYLSAKWIHEFHNENRPEIDHVFLSVSLSFD